MWGGLNASPTFTASGNVIVRDPRTARLLVREYKRCRSRAASGRKRTFAMSAIGQEVDSIPMQGFREKHLTEPHRTSCAANARL